MEGKKASNQGIIDEEIIQIEIDFRQIFGEMCELVSNPMFTDIFRHLHNLLMDSHQKNKKLTEIVQFLNGQIVSNATKVASLLKMSEDDQKSIDQYKEEYSKTWRLVNASNEKENKALEICENLKDQINKLSAEVQHQSSSENRILELKTDAASFLGEIKTTEHEFQVLSSDLNQMNAKLSIALSGCERFKKEVEELTNSVKNEEQRISHIRDQKEQYQKEIEAVVYDSKDDDTVIANNTTQIKALQKTINSNRQEIIRYRSVLKEYQNDQDVIRRKIKSWSETRDRILHSVQKNQNKIRHMTIRVNSSEEEFEKQMGKSQKMDEILTNHYNDLEKAKQHVNDVAKLVQLAQRERKNKHQEMVDIMRAHGVAESYIRTHVRECDFALRQIQNLTANVKEAELVTKEAEDINNIVDNAISTEKNDQQITGMKAHDLEWETKIYEQKSHDAKVQYIRLLDNNGIMKSELSVAVKNLEKLEKSDVEHDKFIHDMRHDRDIISNQIEGIVTENANMNADITAKNEELLCLKADIQKRTEECISVHFETRSVEKQIHALNGVVDMTKKLCEEARGTIVGYKAEKAKLHFIFDEAHKDIALAKGEMRSIDEISRLIERQLCRKRDEATKATSDIKTLECQLKMRMSDFEKQTDQLFELQEELENKIYKNRFLSQRSSSSCHLQMESITLESRLIHEKELRNRFEEEFERPMNIHRWTILQAMSPHIYKQISLIHYLKQQLEKVERQQIKLNDKKKSIKKAIDTYNIRMKNCKIQDGKYAIGVIKDTIAKKDKELEEMENELKEKTNYMKEMQETVSNTKLRVKQSYIATSTAKRQMTKADVPNLPIAPKYIERMRLGGGFNLSTQKDKLNDALPKTTRPDYRRKNEDDDSNYSSSTHFGAFDSCKNSEKRSKKQTKITIQQEFPVSARTISAQSWKPKKTAINNVTANPELSVRPTISVRPNTELNGRDSIRRKPMKTAPRKVESELNLDFTTAQEPMSARRTKVTSAKSSQTDASSKSSARSKASSNLSNSSRKQISVHVANFNIPF